MINQAEQLLLNVSTSSHQTSTLSSYAPVQDPISALVVAGSLLGGLIVVAYLKDRWEV